MLRTPSDTYTYWMPCMYTSVGRPSSVIPEMKLSGSGKSSYQIQFPSKLKKTLSTSQSATMRLEKRSSSCHPWDTLTQHSPTFSWKSRRRCRWECRGTAWRWRRDNREVKNAANAAQHHRHFPWLAIKWKSFFFADKTKQHKSHTRLRKKYFFRFPETREFSSLSRARSWIFLFFPSLLFFF